MTNENTNLVVTAKVKIKKYAEGHSEEHGDPFEIIEHDVIFRGAEAAQVIKEMGGKPYVTN